MKQEPIFLLPVFKERLWGGRKLNEEFGYSTPSENTGECWAISAHPHGQSIVRDGEFAGKKLGELWNEQPELFGRIATSGVTARQESTFPLLTKILDANMDLSVQVHPDDAYAMKNENGEHGKTECWYIIDCDPNAEIIYGHNAAQMEEFEQLIKDGEWNALLRRVPICPGDFVYVPSGTIHALRSGTLVLETQQSSDTTYRLCDYDRKDAGGKRRELHIKKAMEVTSIPHIDPHFPVTKQQTGDLQITTFIENEFFCVYKWNVDGEAEYRKDLDFLLVSVLEGNGEMITEQEKFRFHKGDHFIVPFSIKTFKLKGSSQWIVSGVLTK